MRAEPAVHHRLAGPQRDLPERQRQAFGGERLLHQVVVADRGAAGGHQDVGAEHRGRGAPRRRSRRGGRARCRGRSTSPPSRRASAMVAIAVGIDDLRRAPASVPGITSSSPVASTATLGRRCTGTARVVHGGGEREVAVGEAAALAQQHGARAEIEPGDADVAALARRAVVDDDGVALARRCSPGSRWCRRRRAARRR